MHCGPPASVVSASDASASGDASGGGAASPVQVERKPEDLYQDNGFPNYHYVVFTMHGNTMTGTMVRLADPSAATPEWDVKDTFEVKAK